MRNLNLNLTAKSDGGAQFHSISTVTGPALIYAVGPVVPASVLFCQTREPSPPFNWEMGKRALERGRSGANGDNMACKITLVQESSIFPLRTPLKRPDAIPPSLPIYTMPDIAGNRNCCKKSNGKRRITLRIFPSIAKCCTVFAKCSLYVDISERF